MTILATIFLAVLAFFGLTLGSNSPEPLPFDEKPAEHVAAGAPAKELWQLVALDDEIHGDLPWAEGAKLVATATEVLSKRLGPGFELTNMATEAGEPLAIHVKVRPGADYDEARFRRLVTSSGEVEFVEFVTDGQLKAKGTDLFEERKCLVAWKRQHEGSYLEEFNSIRPADGGPPKGTRWVRSGVAEPAFRMVHVRDDPAQRFMNKDLDFARTTLDAAGRKALILGIAPARQVAFEAFTAKLVGMQLAVVVDEEILTAPVVNDPLRTAAVITGGRFGFTGPELHDLVQLLNHPLPGIRLRVR